MKHAEWKDGRGYLHRALVRDGDPDSLAPQGVPQDVPDLGKIDWDDLRRELHNELHRRGLFTWEDVQRSQNGLTGAVLAVMRRRLVALYREANIQVERR
jgi:sugar phosphate isomerase/epimerase